LWNRRLGSTEECARDLGFATADRAGGNQRRDICDNSGN
jgi:hypothetical protein